jgi:hypothetical protein
MAALQVTALVVSVAAACSSSTSSRDAARPDSKAVGTDAGEVVPDALMAFRDADIGSQADVGPGTAESGADATDVPVVPWDGEPDRWVDAGRGSVDSGFEQTDAAVMPFDLGARPEIPDSSVDVGMAALDLGTAGDVRAASETAVPSACVGEDLFVDVTDQRSSSSAKRLRYPCSSTYPIAYLQRTGGTLELEICARENSDSSGAGLGLGLLPAGQDSGSFAFTGVSWSPSGGSTSMTDRCGGGNSVTITRFDSGGGILEGSFTNVAVGYSCEGIDAILSCHFRVCYVPNG